MRARPSPDPTTLARVAVAVMVTLGACHEDPPPRTSPRRGAHYVQGNADAGDTRARAQDPDSADPKRVPDADIGAFEVKLRAEQTRVGEAVRIHVSVRQPGPGQGPGLEPVVSVDGPATAEAVGRELLEPEPEPGPRAVDLVPAPARDPGATPAPARASRERFDFRIEPTAPGTVVVEVRVPGRDAGQSVKLEVIPSLTPAALARQLASHGGRLARGRQLARQGDYRRALEVYRAALDAQPNDAVVLGELGWAAFLANDVTLARRATREALRLQHDPRARGALLYNLGRIAETLGRDVEAAEAYRRSLRVRPEAPVVRARLRWVEDRAGLPPAPRCEAPGCPLAEPVEDLRACEIIEEEACRGLRSPSRCRCSLDEVERLGPWRLLTLREPGTAAAGPDDAGFSGAHQVHVVLEAVADGRFRVFPPLWVPEPPSRFVGGVAGAERPSAASFAEVLRIDLAGQSGDTSWAWTILCADTGTQASCSAPLLREHAEPDGPRFAARLELQAARDQDQDKDKVAWTVETGTAPRLGDPTQFSATPLALEQLLF